MGKDGDVFSVIILAALKIITISHWGCFLRKADKMETSRKVTSEKGGRKSTKQNSKDLKQSSALWSYNLFSIGVKPQNYSIYEYLLSVLLCARQNQHPEEATQNIQVMWSLASSFSCEYYCF